MLDLYIDNQEKILEKKLILKNTVDGRRDNNTSPALFLDRDGVVIKDTQYISKPENVILEKGILNLLNAASSSGFKIIIITNQSGISRGFYGWNEYMKITEKILELIGNDILFDGIYANGYSSISDNNWRKPNIGMILNAKYDFNIDLQKSILIGDRLSDIKTGYDSGIKKLFHVMTGHGRKERKYFDSFLSKKRICILKKDDLFLESNKKSISLTFIDDLTTFPLSIFCANNIKKRNIRKDDF